MFLFFYAGPYIDPVYAQTTNFELCAGSCSQANQRRLFLICANYEFRTLRRIVFTSQSEKAIPNLRKLRISNSAQDPVHKPIRERYSSLAQTTNFALCAGSCSQANQRTLFLMCAN